MRRISDKEIIENLPTSTSMKNLIEKIGTCVAGSAYRILNRRIAELTLNTDHWKIYQKEFLTKIANQNEIPLENYLIDGSNIGSNALKKKIFKLNLLKNECIICGQLPEWNGKELVLQLDHINGNRNDNRLENLRILCLHCHSQTETYGGKNNRTLIKCINCDNFHYNIKNKFCDLCYAIYRHKPQPKKINWPDTNVLMKMIHELNFVQTGKILGVSDGAIKKHLKSENINVEEEFLKRITYKCDFCFKESIILKSDYIRRLANSKNKQIFCSRSCSSASFQQNKKNIK